MQNIVGKAHGRLRGCHIHAATGSVIVLPASFRLAVTLDPLKVSETLSSSVVPVGPSTIEPMRLAAPPAS